jgi:hypothetical protein
MVRLSTVEVMVRLSTVNHLEDEAIQDAQDVAVGMFPIESHPAKVLFDTGATHSFVSTSWVEAHDIPIEPMIPPLRVNSVRGKVMSDRMCPNLRIEIRGIDFPANLVVMGTQGLDAILGMNWLHRNKATISCDKRTVKLVSPSGKEVVTELYFLELEGGALIVDATRSFMRCDNLIEWRCRR